MSAPAIAPALAAEIDRGWWMYRWPLTETVTIEPLGANLMPVHTTRAEMIEPFVRTALAAAGPASRALDLACNEGWFSHRLLEWGAATVLGIEARADTVRRAGLLRDHYGLAAERLDFRAADVFALDPETLGQFDVVLCLGLIYHLERPLEMIRLARRLTRGICVIESQLTRQERPIVRGDGVPNVYSQSAASFAAWVEPDAEVNPLASMPRVMSLVPNRAALEAMPVWAGFDRVERLRAQPHHDMQYVAGDRAIVIAHTGPR